MRIRFWLQRIFKFDSQRSRSLLDLFFLPSLFPRRPLIVREEAQPDKNEAVTDVLCEHAGRTVRLLSSEPVRVDESYEEWVSPLRQLSPDFKPEELVRAVEDLPGFRSEGQSFFPLQEYLQALPGKEGSAVAWVHYCRASRQPAIDLLLHLTGQIKTRAHVVETSVLLIYGSTSVSDKP
jgi:hypothetical protein